MIDLLRSFGAVEILHLRAYRGPIAWLAMRPWLDKNRLIGKVVTAWEYPNAAG
ncbi:MAG: hypothetical protein AAF412_08070 [Pseudomonadota bacterium]